MYDEAAAAGIIIIAVIIGIAVGLIPLIFYLLTLQNTLKEVSPENQKMPPGQVWLILIPLFGLIWQFIVVNRIADSLKAEFAKRAVQVEEDRPGYGIGIAYCILYCCSVVPLLGIFASLGGLVCWIIYWVKIAGYKKTLENSRFITNSFTEAPVAV
ncbi:MAG: hypothetical protein M3R27_11595 [Bacteroidota bacterium]|nr:hypothetical protein [Bacteroidota bacterium]